MLVYEVILISLKAVIPFDFYISHMFMLDLFFHIIHVYGISCLTVQRLNSLGRPMSQIFYAIVPVYNIYFIGILLFCRSTDSLVVI